MGQPREEERRSVGSNEGVDHGQLAEEDSTREHRPSDHTVYWKTSHTGAALVTLTKVLVYAK